MRSVVAVAAGAAAVLLCLAGPVRAQQADEPDPCADVTSRADTGACWAREADRADNEMREAYDALLGKLSASAADALKKAQKAWLEARDTHLALLYAMANPAKVHRWEDMICSAIARREMTRQRARILKRLAEPAKDEACPL